MIGLIRGVLLEKAEESILVEAHGVGYELQVPDSHVASLPPVGEEVRLYTHLIWKEDSISLYGFLKRQERDMFRMLIQVSGVGPKMAMSCLSVLGQQELLRALSSGDVRRLQAISGIGKKTAARLCVDLKEKAKKLLALQGEFDREEVPSDLGVPGATSMDGTLWNEAYSALINLGYRPNEVKQALDSVMKRLGKEGGVEDKDLSKVITMALRHLAR